MGAVRDAHSLARPQPWCFQISFEKMEGDNECLDDLSSITAARREAGSPGKRYPVFRTASASNA